MADDAAPDGSTTTDEILRITPRALDNIARIRSTEAEPEGLGLWVEISGVAGGNYTYDMWFQPAADAGPDDEVRHVGDLPVVIPSRDVDRLRGATLDMNRDLLTGGMVIQNPHRPPTATPPASVSMGMKPADLSGDVAQRVVQVLEQQINPSIASHGGRADLVAVEEDVAYLRLSGGCQGCGLAAATLSQGIEVALVESVPEIRRVVDVTDHASGTNPYFEASKK